MEERLPKVGRIFSGEEVNSPYDDSRSASEFEMDDWCNDTETLVTLAEILALFNDPGQDILMQTQEIILTE